MKTDKVHKTKPNETEAWFRSLSTSSGQEMDRVYSQLQGPALSY